MSTPTITIVGRLTRDPELRTTKTGKNMCSFAIVANDRRYNENNGQWEDTGSFFVNCSAFDSDWLHLATNIANSLHKGTQVIAQGRIKREKYMDRSGAERTTDKLVVDSIGPDLNRYGVDVHEPKRSTDTGFVGNRQNQQAAQSQQPRDPWADDPTGGDTEWEGPSF